MITNAAKDNVKLIEKINSKNDSDFIQFEYSLASNSTDPPSFSVIEDQVEFLGIDIIQGLKFSQSDFKLIEIQDVFNDKLNYSLQNYSDAVRLNFEMIKIASKYEMFGETTRATSELNKFLRNYHTLTKAFDHVLSRLVNGESSKSDISSKLGEINSRFDFLFVRHNFGGRFKTSTVPKGKQFKIG